MAKDVLVLGAGVIGLTTAVCLARAGHRVRVWAELPPERTTSAVASGIWGPRERPRELAWSRISFAEFSRLARIPESGVHFERGLEVSDVSQPPPWVQDLVDVRFCTPDELPEGMRAGLWATTPLIDLPRYLRYLTEELAAAEIVIESRTVRDLAEATAAASIVVNCTGVGAAALTGDPEVRPVRGQHVILRNPGLTYYYCEAVDTPEWTSFYPHGDRLILGGIRQPDDWTLTPDPALSERILQRCIAIEPKLAAAEILGHEVGLRPGRPEPRLEPESRDGATVIHNYGHDGVGVTLSWGSAQEVVRMTAEIAGR
ncbi:FAD-binding oxidoreductase [Nocardia panacis]|uniref:D-amino-acid oxidase n=1 Tax=Nocardia panacis TaxID=2340916 RepID=A0A3A4KA04_9NOCA|nr:FAD-dependent oxidoreductase [Nocardia panacis]RJO69292.1 FAD-binding oxidoreductase [Nocardia panacis]